MDIEEENKNVRCSFKFNEIETFAEVDVSPDADDLASSSFVDFQIELFLVLGIIIGILLIGDRRF